MNGRNLLLFILSLFTLFPRPQREIAKEEKEHKKKWKQFLSQLCYCLQNNLYIRREFFLFHLKLPSSVWLSVLFCPSPPSSQDKLLEKIFIQAPASIHTLYIILVLSLLLLFFYFVFVEISSNLKHEMTQEKERERETLIQVLFGGLPFSVNAQKKQEEARESKNRRLPR